jgi:hypothetical protein
MELGRGGKGKENGSQQSQILHICTGRGQNDMYWKLLNNGGGREGMREDNRGG